MLAVLADGMGGHIAGERASQIAVSRYLETFSATQGAIAQLLDQSLVASNDAIGSEIRKSPMLAGMGCTLVAAYVNQEGLRWVSVGDSALLLYRGSDLIRLNEDHSLGALLDEQAKAHQISVDEAKSDPRRRALRSALVGGDIAVKDLRLDPEPLLHGDWVIIASDGLETLDGNEIATIIGRRKELGDPKAAVKDLLDAIRKKAVPKQDNVSIIAIKIVDLADASTEVVATPPPQVEAVEKLKTAEPASANYVGNRALPVALGVLALSIICLLVAWYGLSPVRSILPETGKAVLDKPAEKQPALPAPQQGQDQSSPPAPAQSQPLEKTEAPVKGEESGASPSTADPAKSKEAAPKDKKQGLYNQANGRQRSERSGVQRPMGLNPLEGVTVPRSEAERKGPAQ